MINKDQKIFVGGYYESDIDIIHMAMEYSSAYTPPYYKDGLDAYTLSEALELAFLDTIDEWFEEEYEKSWEETTEEEKIKAILKYTADDELAGLEYCQDAISRKAMILEELEELEKLVADKISENE